MSTLDACTSWYGPNQHKNWTQRLHTSLQYWTYLKPYLQHLPQKNPSLKEVDWHASLHYWAHHEALLLHHTHVSQVVGVIWNDRDTHHIAGTMPVSFAMLSHLPSVSAYAVSLDCSCPYFCCIAVFLSLLHTFSKCNTLLSSPEQWRRSEWW